MSSKPHVSRRAEKSSLPHPDARETSATKPCPHCGGALDTSLAEHMARRCDASEYDTAERSPPERDPDPDVPVLEEAPEQIDVNDELEERRALADRLADAGAWVDMPDREDGSI